MIHLQRVVEVQAFDLQATIAVARSRPEFLAVARLAADLGRPIGGADVARELLGNLPEAVGWRVLQRAVDLGVLRRGGDRGPAELSDAGLVLLERGEVLVPEEGVWRFFLVADPLVAMPLVHVHRMATDAAKDERAQLYKRQRGDRPAAGRAPPKVLRDHLEVLLRSVADGGSFQIRDLGDRGETGPAWHLLLSLDVDANAAIRVSLRGQLKVEEGSAKAVDTLLALPSEQADLTYEEIWAMLVSTASGLSEDLLFEWMEAAGAPVLPGRMDGWPEPARRSLATDLQIPAFKLADLGPFDATKLEAVALVPESGAAAQAWAEWLLWDSIQRYVVPSEIARLHETVLAKFPLYRPELPDPHALLKRAKAEPQGRTARYLLAPSDLGLWS